MKRNLLSVENVYLDSIDKNHENSYIRLLNGVSVEFLSGRLTAIMGTNGSGKSTLVNLIIGRVETDSKTSGCITYNGAEERDKVKWTERIAFQGQKDNFIKSLTVKEYLMYEICFYRKDLTSDQKGDLLIDVMNRADISKNKNEVIQDVSEGEIKKMMIADILLQDAEIVFLDEPTSWLDSSQAFAFIQNMKDLAVEKNIIVAIVMNQASQEVFNLFDDMIFIKPGGNLFYSGPVSEIDKFLERQSLKRDEGVPTHFYLYLLLSVTSDINIPVAGSTFTNKIDSSIKVYSGLNEIFTGSGFSFTDVKTILKRRLAYGYSEKEFGIMFFVKLFLCFLISYFIEKKVEKINLNVFDKMNFKNVKIRDLSFISNLKCLLMHSRILNFYLGLINGLSKILAPTFFDKNEILTNEIFQGKFSTSSLYVSSLIFDLVFRLLTTTFLISFLFGRQSQYILNPWILSLTIVSLLFSVVIHSFVSTIQRKFYYTIISIIIYMMFIFVPDFVILQVYVKNRENKSYYGGFLSKLLLLTLVVNPTNWLKLIWYSKTYDSEEYFKIFEPLRKIVFELKDDSPVLKTLLIEKAIIDKSFLGFRGVRTWIYFIFGILSLSYIVLTYFLFRKKASPSIRLKLKK